MAELRSKSPFVQATGVGRIFRQGGEDIQALSNVNCIISPWDCIAITGPSGSGKSTLLQLLAGLDSPSSGNLSWPARQDGQPLRPAYLSIALQTPDLLPALTVLENVELPLLLMHKLAEEAERAAREILDRLGLADLSDQLPEELSGGQAQRVTLARALVTHPRLILADEPTGQLDHPTANVLFDALLTFLNDDDTALVIATHDQAIAERMSIQWKIERGILQI